jgi:hypothetical protein
VRDSPVLLPRELPAGVRDAARVTRSSVAVCAVGAKWWRSNAKERSHEAYLRLGSRTWRIELDQQRRVLVPGWRVP